METISRSCQRAKKALGFSVGPPRSSRRLLRNLRLYVLGAELIVAQEAIEKGQDISKNGRRRLRLLQMALLPKTEA